MSSKKARSKKVSQNDLRKMMNQMKSKRTTDSKTMGRSGRSLLNNQDAYQKALNDQKKLQALIGGSRSKDTTLSERKENLNSNINSSNERDISLKRSQSTKDRVSSTTTQLEGSPPSKTAKTESKQDEKSSGLLIGEYSSDSDENTTDKPEAAAEPAKKLAEDSTKKKVDSSLPEGFFDDPEVDAKMRGVETPADAMDREWEEFQKEIQRETDQSEQIVEEEEEVDKVDREIEEIDEQIMHFSRVEKLSDTRDEIKQKSKLNSTVDKRDNSDSDSEIEADDGLLDWREKDSYF